MMMPSLVCALLLFDFDISRPRSRPCAQILMKRSPIDFAFDRIKLQRRRMKTQTRLLMKIVCLSRAMIALSPSLTLCFSVSNAIVRESTDGRSSFQQRYGEQIPELLAKLVPESPPQDIKDICRLLVRFFLSLLHSPSCIFLLIRETCRHRSLKNSVTKSSS